VGKNHEGERNWYAGSGVDQFFLWKQSVLLCSNYQSRNDVGWVKIMKEKEAGMQAAESISISYGSNPCLKQKAKNDDGWIESR